MSADYLQIFDGNQPPRRFSSDPLIRRLEASKHPSAMLERFSLWSRLLMWVFFGIIRFETRCLDNLRDAAENATIVYALQSRSLIDQLYYNSAFLQYGLPLARVSNGRTTTLFRPILGLLAAIFWWLLSPLKRRFPSRPEAFAQAVANRQSTLLFLEKPSVDEYRKREVGLPYLAKLIDLSEKAEVGPVYVVPLLLEWEKRSESYHKTLFDEVFGTRSSPGFIRKSYELVLSFVQSLFRAGAPTVQVSSAISLQSFARDNALSSRPEKVKLLGDTLAEVFKRERQVIVGPPLKPAAMIQAEVLDSEPVDQAIVHITRTKPEYPSVVKRQAAKIIKEISADFNLFMIKILSATLNPVFEILYQGFEIDADGLDRVRKLATDKRIVIVPSHKSHIDYLIISKVFYSHGLMPPHIIAGVNLSFWPLGFIFRHAGAFFLRRSFKGDHLYATIFQQYMVHILKEGFPIEFFIEGTRSRTGKLCRPRFGILSMIIDGALRQNLDRIAFIPISVTYEKIIEGSSYKEESLGKEKSSENISGVLRASRFLRSKYGRLYIDFEEPIDLDRFLEDRSIDQTTSPEARRESLTQLAAEIIHRINKATTVTPSAIVATALLNLPVEEMDQLGLAPHVGFITNRLSAHGVRLSNSIRGSLTVYRMEVSDRSSSLLNQGFALSSSRSTSKRETAHPTTATGLPNWEVGRALEALIRETLGLLVKSDSLRQKKVANRGLVYRIEEHHRIDLSYYRNTIIHFLIPDAYLATALLVGDQKVLPEASLLERFEFLADVFKLEFSLGHEERHEDTFHFTLARFIEDGWCLQELPGDPVRLPDPIPLELRYSAQLLRTWLQSYWLVSEALGSVVNLTVATRDFFKYLMTLGKRSPQVRDEALSKQTFINAIDWFKEKGVITITEEGSERRRIQLIQVAQPYRLDSRWRFFPDQLGLYLEAISEILPAGAFHEEPEESSLTTEETQTNDPSLPEESSLTTEETQTNDPSLPEENSTPASQETQTGDPSLPEESSTASTEEPTVERT